MRTKSILITMALMLALPAAALAGCPTEGVYSTGLGTMQEGRSSDAWCSGTVFQDGDLIDSQSWDGGALAGEWTMGGMEQTSATWDDSGYDAGTETGWRVVTVTYADGSYWMSKDAAWGDGANDVVGSIINAVGTYTMFVFQGVVQTANSTITSGGTINNCSTCMMNFTITQSERVWAYEENGPAAPADFPAMLCGGGEGSLWNVTEVAVAFDCTVGVDYMGWGQVKALYR